MAHPPHAWNVRTDSYRPRGGGWTGRVVLVLCQLKRSETVLVCIVDEDDEADSRVEAWLKLTL